MRLTPAHEGKIKEEKIMKIFVKAHPRACGEDLLTAIIGISVKGSPPRMRGRSFEECEKEEKERLTPAHAGKIVVIKPILVSSKH